MRSVEEWTDYIYIGNAWEGIPRAVLVISPPQNHGGKYGYAVCVDGYITRLTEIQIRALVDEPWGLDTNASVSNINYLKKQIFVNVPKKWRRYYLRPN